MSDLKFERSVLSQKSVRSDPASVYLLFRLLDELATDSDVNFQLQVFVLELLLASFYSSSSFIRVRSISCLFIFLDFPRVRRLGPREVS